MVVIEEAYRSYREALMSSIRMLRSHIDVAVVGLDTPEERIKCFDPHVAICTVPSTATGDAKVVWEMLSLEPHKASVICVGGNRSERSNLQLGKLLGVIDEAEHLIGK